jgi:5-methyltetrahydrofolate--homocysteine methyltransferase
MVKALAFCRSFAEYLLNKFGKKFGAMLRGTIEHRAMIEEIYKGIRPAPGYPLVQITENHDLEITKCRKGDRSNLDGEHGDVARFVCIWILFDPESKYFGLGK